MGERDRERERDGDGTGHETNVLGGHGGRLVGMDEVREEVEAEVETVVESEEDPWDVGGDRDCVAFCPAERECDSSEGLRASPTTSNVSSCESSSPS